jgi:hypothetical protein
MAAMAGTSPRKPIAPVRRAKLFIQATNFGRSVGGRPSSSQMTDSGSLRAYPSTRSAGHPSAKSPPANPSAMARMRGSISRIARCRKASSTMPRNRVWSGPSIVSMFSATARTMPGIHQRSLAIAPPSRRRVNPSLSFRTRAASPCVVVIQTLPTTAGCPQLLDRSGRVAKILLVGEVGAPQAHPTHMGSQARTSAVCASRCRPARRQNSRNGWKADVSRSFL